jgi:hypothetical protein
MDLLVIIFCGALGGVWIPIAFVAYIYSGRR